MAVSSYQKWIIGVLLSLITIANVWASLAFLGYKASQEGIRNRITKLEKEQITKEDLKEANCFLLDKIDARFDRFELYILDKYKITKK